MVVSQQGVMVSGWSLNMVVSQQGGLRVVFHQGGLSVVFYQGSLSSWWSLNRVVCHHDGLGVVFHQGGFSSWWSLSRVVRHHDGFSMVSLEGFQCIHRIPLTPLLFICFSPGCCGKCVCLLQVFPKPPPNPVQFERQQSWNRDQQRMVKYRVCKHTKTANSDWIGLYRVSYCRPSATSTSTQRRLALIGLVCTG